MTNALHGLPERLGRYALVGVLGRGGMGRVVQARDDATKRDVALKLIETAAVDPEAVEELRFLFHREARAVAKLKHPNIVEMVDYSGPEAELPYLACELLDGPTLYEVITNRGPLPESAVAALGHELSRALAYAHGEGVVHRDIKPDNVFYLNDGRVVLSDFGLAKARDHYAPIGASFQFGQTNLYGSPSYMAPEQLRDTAATPAIDIYALGALLYECLVGRPAFGGTDVEAILRAVRSGQFTPIQKSLATGSMRALIGAMLAREPSARPKSMDAVARSLRQILDTLRVDDPRAVLAQYLAKEATRTMAIAPAMAPARRVSEPHGTRRTFLPYAVLAGLIGIGGGVVFWPRPHMSATTHQQADEAVMTTLNIEGEGRLFIDGGDRGVARGPRRIALSPGRHRVRLVFSGGGAIAREIMIVEGTAPVIELAAD